MSFTLSLAVNSVQSYAIVNNSRLSDVLVKLSGSYFPFATRSFPDFSTINYEPFKVAIGKNNISGLFTLPVEAAPG